MIHNKKTSDFIKNNTESRSGYKWSPTGFFGYPGLEFTKHKICEYIPKCNTFIEPFGGMGRITELVLAEIKIVNDKSDFAYNQLKSKFPTHIVENMDFVEFLDKYPNGDVYFFDPPWIKSAYDERTKAFCNREIKEYYDIILDFCNKTKSLVFVCGQKDRKIGNLYFEIIEGRRKIGGHTAKTRLSSNKPLKRHNQSDLFSF